MSEPKPRLVRRLLRALVALGALVVLAIPMSGAAEPTIPGAVTFQASKPQVIYGGWVQLTGHLSSNPPCQDDREVRLRSIETGGTWKAVKTTTSATDGTFSFGLQPQRSAGYDVWIPSIGSCERVVSSPAVGVAVAARLTFAGPENGVQVGSCGVIRTTVEPAQEGTPVKFQRRIGTSWVTFATAALGNSSGAQVQVCPRWEDLGTNVWRASWSAADAGSTQYADGASPSFRLKVVKAPWMVRLDRLIGSRNMGVAVASEGGLLYEHRDGVEHVPASNEKLLLSMALLSRLSPDATLTTSASAFDVGQGGVIRGGLWLIGRGDPTVNKQDIARLADAIVSAGITKITGSVHGSIGYFAHDWMAPGWKPEFPEEEVAMPTALTYNGNTVEGRHVSEPERVAAAALSRALRARGVTVIGTAKTGLAPAGLHAIVRVTSPPLREILHEMNIDSVNFDAEVLGKLLGVLAAGAPGTIDKGADAVHDWAASHDVSTVSEDGSGLSYANRISALGLLHLLQAADGSSWGGVLRSTLAVPGEGTLEHRLAGISVQAKTGTLDDISALSGWVDLTRTGHAAQFSILSGGLDISAAKDIEDSIVTALAKFAR